MVNRKFTCCYSIEIYVIVIELCMFHQSYLIVTHQNYLGIWTLIL